MEYISNELSKLGIVEFEHQRGTLAMKLFIGKHLNTDEKKRKRQPPPATKNLSRGKTLGSKEL